MPLMSRDLLPCVEIEPPVPARCTVIWLHGLGADGHDFEPIVPLLGMPADVGVRFVFPNAPKIPVTLNGGFVMPAWYDITDLDAGNRQDEPGIQRSADSVRALIEREKQRGVPTERIVLAGFSQGGAIALHVALRHPEALAGVIALSTYLVDARELESELSAANRSTPVFQAHGTYDPTVPMQRGEEARQRLEALGYELSWHAYPMQHEVCPQEIQELGTWLRARLERSSSESAESSGRG